MSNELLFKGLKVIDACSWIAAPAASLILADYGAEVIKIEAPDRVDGLREYKNYKKNPKSEKNYPWIVDNRNKKGLTLNLKTDEGQKIFRDLIKETDVFIVNTPLNVRRRLKVTYNDVVNINPRIIYASLTAFGEKGPDAELPGFDLTSWWARSGMMAYIHPPGIKKQSRELPGQGDHPSSIALYAGIVTALYRREKTGVGSKVSTSLLANGVWCNATLVQAKLVNADFDDFFSYLDKRKSIRDAEYITKDGRTVFFTMVRTMDDFYRFARALGMEDKINKDIYPDIEEFKNDEEQFIAEIGERIRKKTWAEWKIIFEKNKILPTLSATIDEVVKDPQLKANGMIVPVKDESLKREYPFIVNHPVCIHDIKSEPVKKAPSHGEHNVEILQGLNYSLTEIEELKKKNII